MMDELKDKILKELHDLCGVCGHCGSHDCAGRFTHSVLPEKLLRKDVITAIDNTLSLESWASLENKPKTKRT